MKYERLPSYPAYIRTSLARGVRRAQSTRAALNTCSIRDSVQIIPARERPNSDHHCVDSDPPETTYSESVLLPSVKNTMLNSGA